MQTDLTQFQPPSHPSDIQLQGAWVGLVPLSAPSHGEQLFESNTNADNWTYLPYGPFPDKALYLEWLTEQSQKQDPCFFAVVRQVDQRAIGLASFLRIDRANGVIEIGHLNFSPCLQQTRESTEALFLMMHWAFEAGYRRVEWKCNALNQPSRRAAQRLGFSYEGTFRQAAIHKGKNRDTAWFALLDREWPAIKACFEEYLASENFDDNGRAKFSLSAMTRPLLFALDND